MTLVGYVPARCGSKRLKDKNFKDFHKGISLTEIALQKSKQIGKIKFTLLDTDNDLFNVDVTISEDKQEFNFDKLDDDDDIVENASSSMALEDSLLSNDDQSSFISNTDMSNSSIMTDDDE